MADKRIVHAKFSEKIPLDTDSIDGFLRCFATQTEDALDFEEILNNAVLSLYLTMPNGMENYSRENPKIGTVVLDRSNQPVGWTGVFYIPSSSYEKKYGYVKKTIGRINLREKTYGVVWNEYDEKCYMIPDGLMRDTDKVMEKIGLSRSMEAYDTDPGWNPDA